MRGGKHSNRAANSAVARGIFCDDHAGFDRSRETTSPRIADYSRREWNCEHSVAGSSGNIRHHSHSEFLHFRQCQTGILLFIGDFNGAVFCGAVSLGIFAHGSVVSLLQQNEELASSIGVNITYLRGVAYAISSFLGGIDRAIFATISQSIYPSSFTIADSINFMLNCFLGGLGYVFGPILGTFVLYFGWDWLFQTGKYQLLIFSTALIVLMLFLPNGLLSIRLPKKRPTNAKSPVANETR